MDRETKEKYVHQVFESIADRYDRMNTLLSFRRHKAWRKFTMEKLSLQPGQSALDVCCGTGDWTLSLAERTGEKGRVVGLDFSQKMLEVARRKLKQRSLHHVELVHGNAMRLPFAEQTFDVATIGFALRNVPDIDQVLAEMARVVKPGGIVASLELSKPVWPVFKQLYYVYFNHLLPWLGQLFANRYEQYSWLPESLKDFPDSLELGRKFEQAGLENVEIYLLTGGIAALHIGYKPKEKGACCAEQKG